MLLNEGNCTFMIIESAKNLRNNSTEIKIHNRTLKETKEAKLLGITFDNNLTMRNHVKTLCNQASNKLYALARISQYMDERKRIILMKSFVISQFTYCPIIWMFSGRKSNNLVNRIHERALRIAYNDYVSDFNSLLLRDKSLTIHQQNIQTLCIEIYKTLHDLNPIFMKEIFSLNQHKYSTRKQHLSYPNPCTVTYGLETFGYKASQIWGSLPREIQEASDLKDFKNKISLYSKTPCKCNSCIPYISNLGYINTKE